MSSFILHHGTLSPFAEKIRSMLGHAQLSWLSSPALEVPPRPLLSLLTGGYRRMPVAQIGADKFCDTRMIADEVAAMANNPLLDYESLSLAERQIVDNADLHFFQAGMAQSLTITLVRNVLRVRSLRDFFAIPLGSYSNNTRIKSSLYLAS